MKSSNIGKTIQLLRKRAGLTQKDLAVKLCITDKAVSKWERGLSYPDVAYINKLAKILDVDSDALFIEEDKHMSSTWSGILYVPNSKNNISLKTKINNKSIFSLIICYYLLVNITDILIVCDNRDISFLENEYKFFLSHNINIVFSTINEFNKFGIYNSFVQSSNIMLIYDLFFIYGVGLTSTFQRAMMDVSKTIFLDNPKIPVVFGKKNSIYSLINSNSFSNIAQSHKMFRGFIKIDLNSKKNLKKCSELIKCIESLGGFDIYNPLDIIKNRNI